MIDSDFTESTSKNGIKNGTGSPVDKIESLLTFTLSGIPCCVDLKDVSAIIDTKELEQDHNIESDDPHIVSASIKIPLVDIYKVNGMSARVRDKNERLLVIEIDNQLMGFIVEKASSIFYIDKTMRSKLKYSECKNLLHLNGLIKYEDEMFFLIDLKDLLKNELNR